MHLGRVDELKTAEGARSDDVRRARAWRGTKIPLKKEEKEKEKEKEKEEKNRTLL